MPDLDMTETTISLPRYAKVRAFKLAKALTRGEGRYVSQKELVATLINQAWAEYQNTSENP